MGRAGSRSSILGLPGAFVARVRARACGDWWNLLHFGSPRAPPGSSSFLLVVFAVGQEADQVNFFPASASGSRAWPELPLVFGPGVSEEDWILKETARTPEKGHLLASSRDWRAAPSMPFCWVGLLRWSEQSQHSVSHSAAHVWLLFKWQARAVRQCSVDVTRYALEPDSTLTNQLHH
jgi:hypothetical protein